MLPPSGLEHLIVNGQLPTQLIPDATKEWQSTLREVQQGAPMGVQERFFFLTLILTQAISKMGDEARKRGMVESAIETLQAPQHRYQLRASMARSAVRVGDVASAKSWLAGCDSVSFDLEVDSEYRTAAAFIATAQKDWNAVLKILGQRTGDVPIADSTMSLVTIVRANALERLGRGPEALAQLQALDRDGDTWSTIRGYNQFLDLCPNTIQHLLAQKKGALGNATGGTNPDALPNALAQAGSLGRGINYVISGIFGVIGIAMIIGGFFVNPKSRTDDGLMRTNLFLWMLGGFFVLSPIVMTLFTNKLLGSFGSLAGLAGGSAKANWQKADAQILSVQSTGWEINDQPQLALQVRVFYANRPPYEASLKICVAHHQVEQIKPGLSMKILVDPQSPTNISTLA